MRRYRRGYIGGMATPVDRLEPGDHACLTYTDPVERQDILAAFVADGLDRGEKVISYTENEQLWDGTAGPDARTIEELANGRTRGSSRAADHIGHLLGRPPPGQRRAVADVRVRGGHALRRGQAHGHL